MSKNKGLYLLLLISIFGIAVQGELEFQRISVNYLVSSPLPKIFGWDTFFGIANSTDIIQLDSTSDQFTYLALGYSQNRSGWRFFSLNPKTMETKVQLEKLLPPLSGNSRIFQLKTQKGNVLLINPGQSAQTISCSNSSVCNKVEQTLDLTQYPFSNITQMVEFKNQTIYLGTDKGLLWLNLAEQQAGFLPEFQNQNILSVAYSENLNILVVGTDLKVFIIYLSKNFWRFEYTDGYFDKPLALCFRNTDNSLWLASEKGGNVVRFFSENGFDYYQIDRIDFQTGLPIGNLSFISSNDQGEVVLAGKYGIVYFNSPLDEILNINGVYKKSWMGAGQIASTTQPFRYFNDQRWIQSGSPERFFLSKNGQIASSNMNGFSVIYKTQVNLREKAAVAQDIVKKRHMDFGYVDSTSLLYPGYVNGSFKESLSSDNSGLWTNMYIASQAFRYSVTKDEEAKAAAKTAFDAVLRLYQVIPPQYNGFMAKALMPREDVLPENWFYSENPGFTQWMYKGGTSADDVISYYYAIPLYIDLVADTQEEKDLALSMIINTTDYIMKNNYTLMNVNGERTRWGFWNPENLNDNPEYYSERYSRSIDILAILSVAYRYTGAQKYLDGLNWLGFDNQYLENIINSRGTYPQDENFSDDELNYLALGAFFWNTSRTPEVFIEYYKEALKHTWAIV